MPRVDAVAAHPLFRAELAVIEAAEAERAFCRHGLSHLLDVARLAWIRALEEGLALDRELVYVAALLHDIGRAEQYRVGTPHDMAGERVAAEILGTLEDGDGFSGAERELVLAAVRGHRSHGGTADGGAFDLPGLIVWADHASRPCFACPAADACYWPAEKRNLNLEI